MSKKPSGKLTPGWDDFLKETEVLVWDRWDRSWKWETMPDYEVRDRVCPRCNTNLKNGWTRPDPHSIEECIEQIGAQIYKMAERGLKE
jgi:hypothetical protein